MLTLDGIGLDRATPLDLLETPVPVVDLDRLERNLDRMAAYVREHGLALRPHIKTHKSPWVARQQLRRGAVGLTCATPRELEVMAPAADDLLLAYPPVGRPRAHRLAALTRDVRLTVALDSVRAVTLLAEAARERGREVHVLVEADLGMHRVGATTVESVIDVVRAVRANPPLAYDGVAFYPGHIRDRAERQDDKLERLQSDLGTLLAALSHAGLAPRVVSGGSTPTAWRMHEVAGVTEVRPGTYVYNDRATQELGACAWEDCALTVLATVVSTAVPGHAVIDAGTKALGREPLPGGESEGYGALLDHPEVRVVRMSEEHGILDLRGTTWRPEVGALVRVVPNHVCVTVHLYDRIVGARGEHAVAEWAVAARGR
ncbi:MAG TPA: alanine racemase [Gemmatimonadaceae bacterium]|nr:alanine racemase [Gemmatimonadaceae bacterium]